MAGKKNKVRKEDGAMVIEASLSLTLFMFVIVMILSFVNVCIAQAKIGMALNQTAKEISQYTYIYSLTGFNEIQAEMNAGTAEVKEDVMKAEDAVFSSLNGVIGLASGDTSTDEVIETVSSSIEDMENLAVKIASSGDRKAWVMSLLD